MGKSAQTQRLAHPTTQKDREMSDVGVWEGGLTDWSECWRLAWVRGQPNRGLELRFPGPPAKSGGDCGERKGGAQNELQAGPTVYWWPAQTSATCGW